jgi:spore cortex formation protein SpoVR/YcgB (stage V sporulation)
MLIELMPVLAKTLLPSGTYDEKVRLTEEMEKEVAEANQQKEKGLKELYNALAKEKDETFIREFFASSEKKDTKK